MAIKFPKQDITDTTLRLDKSIIRATLKHKYDMEDLIINSSLSPGAFGIYVALVSDFPDFKAPIGEVVKQFIQELLDNNMIRLEV